MSALIQLVARLASITALPADTAENVIHVDFEGAVLDVADVTPLMESFRDFYIDGSAPVGDSMAGFISESVSRAANACQILAYSTLDYSGATPFGSPMSSLNFTMTASLGGDPMPEEVAAVISYAGDLTDVPVSQVNPTPPPATIRPAQRRKGRLFLGPLNTIAGSISGTLFRPSTGFRTDATVAFKRMAEEINAETDMHFGVWSRADEVVWPAESCYMDDAWDTQRRRGVEATTRTSQSITP